MKQNRPKVLSEGKLGGEGGELHDSFSVAPENDVPVLLFDDCICDSHFDCAGRAQGAEDLLNDVQKWRCQKCRVCDIFLRQANQSLSVGLREVEGVAVEVGSESRMSCAL